MTSSSPSTEALRARVRDVMAAVVNADVEQLRAIGRAGRKYRNRLVWRRLYQRRASRISAVIAVVEQMLVAPVAKKAADGWMFTGRGADGARRVAVVLRVTKARTFDDLAQALDVEVVDADLVDCVDLQHRLHHLGVAVA